MKKSNKKHLILIFVTILIIFFVIFSVKTSVKERNLTLTDYFDTVSQITVSAKNDKPLSDIEKYIKKMDKELSTHNSDSTLFKYNNGEKVDFSNDSIELIDFGKQFTEENGNYFSIYLEPLIKAWDIKNNTSKIPDISTLLKESQKKEKIDLGGIAKGFITDKIVDILKEDGVNSAIINLGGNAYAMGKKITGENWKIGIQNPKEDDENSIIGVITAENLAVITSGDYQRYKVIDGIRYHHILDPKTGFPAKNNLRSVTVISDNATFCDALSTACYVAGLDKGIELLKKYNAQGIFITDDTVYFSKSLENIFKQTNFSYKYEFID